MESPIARGTAHKTRRTTIDVTTDNPDLTALATPNTTSAGMFHMPPTPESACCPT
jgi:hypothetical protein